MEDLPPQLEEEKSQSTRALPVLVHKTSMALPQLRDGESFKKLCLEALDKLGAQRPTLSKVSKSDPRQKSQWQAILEVRVSAKEAGPDLHFKMLGHIKSDAKSSEATAYFGLHCIMKGMKYAK